MDTIKNFKDINEVFKRFQKDRHNEDKGRNFNMLQEVFASAEFFDVTKFPLPVTIKEVTDNGSSILYTSDLLQDVCLPFSCQFVHVEDKQYSIKNSLINTSTYVMMREYSPIHITGTIFQVSEEGRRNLPFTITVPTGVVAIGSEDFKKVTPSFSITPFYSKNEAVNLIMNVVATLNSLSDKEILSETPAQVYTEYYRRKGASAIKTQTRKIYYVLSKNDTKSADSIKRGSTGIIEYSHAFKVRGHWRTLESLDSLGKDRHGNRIIKGYTWVTEYVKGEGELVKKIREVK